MLLLWLALQTAAVQNWIITKITNKLSKDLKTTVSIQKVDFDLFNRFIFQGFLIKDQHLDTLGYVGELNLELNNWFFLKDEIEVKSAFLKKGFFHLSRKDSIWNSNFLAEYFKKDTTAQPSNVKFDLKKIKYGLF